jgi:hypothetical protein
VPNKLPTRYEGGLKDKALAVARALVRSNLEPRDYIDGSVHAAPLAPASARPIALAILRRYASMSAYSLSRVVHWAYEGSDEAHEVLGEIAAEYANRREAPPPLLASYVVEQYHARSGRRPGPARAKSFPADICIAMLIALLCEHLPLRPTRSGRSSIKPSACSVMATALSEFGVHRGGEGAVQTIWFRYRDLVMSERHAMLADEPQPIVDTDSFWLGRILTPPRRGDLMPTQSPDFP